MSEFYKHPQMTQRVADAYVKKEMMKVKCGDFYYWYQNLPGYLQEAYKREFNRLQNKYEK